MSKCPKCGEEVDIIENVCTRCGAELPAPYENAQANLDADDEDAGEMSSSLPPAAKAEVLAALGSGTGTADCARRSAGSRN